GVALDGGGAFAGIALAGRFVSCRLLAGLAFAGSSIAVVVPRLGAEAGRLLGLFPGSCRRVVPARPNLAVLGAAKRRRDVPGMQVPARDRGDRGRVEGAAPAHGGGRALDAEIAAD